MPEDEYYISQVSTNKWRIYKVNDLHGKEPEAVYLVTKSHGQFHCDCPAPKFCKHIAMVQPKPKDLF
jgi:hypothetical protein